MIACAEHRQIKHTKNWLAIVSQLKNTIDLDSVF